MNIERTGNASDSFIRPEWLKKGQGEESGSVNETTKSEKITKEAVAGLADRLQTEGDTFGAAYGVEISDEGYAALAQQMSGAQVEDKGNEAGNISEDVRLVYTKKLEHSRWEVPLYGDPAWFIKPITEQIKSIFAHTEPEDRGIQEGSFFMLAQDLNAYLEMSGGTDASGFLGELSEKLNSMKGERSNPLLDRIIDLVETSRSGNYIDTESAAFSDKNATAIESYYHLVKSGQLEGTIAKSAEKTFDAQAVQRLLDKFQSDREVSLLGLVQDDPELNHPLRLSLKDISSANQPESTDSNEAFARKLRDLDK